MITRVLPDRLVGVELKKACYSAHNNLGRLLFLLRNSNYSFTRYILKDFIRFLTNSVVPVEGQSRERAREAADWLIRAWYATSNFGVSYGYFPCDNEKGWLDSYPETTGYIIPTMLEFARRYRYDAARSMALKMSRWEMDIQMESGAVQGGRFSHLQPQAASVFNTGMVLKGWSAAYRECHDESFLLAAKKAAAFMLNDLDDDGYFRTHGPFVKQERIKTYNCLCAWSLFCHGEDAADSSCKEAAIKVTESALRQQKPNGWFANNCLTNGEAPLLHTIGYTLQGILEMGFLTGRSDYIEAVRLGTDPLISRISTKGFLYGRYKPDWEPANSSSCLTGSAQLAVVCYRLYEYTGADQYRLAADRLLNYLKALQDVKTSNLSIKGAIAGSFPLFGEYMTAGYPNWATKYYLDGLILQDRLGHVVDAGSAEALKQKTVGIH